MARSDLTTVVTTWDKRRRQWSGAGVEAPTLGRLKAKMPPHFNLEPQGRVVDDLLIERARLKQAEIEYKARMQSFHQHIVEAVNKHHLSITDAAVLADISKQRVHQLLERARQNKESEAA